MRADLGPVELASSPAAPAADAGLNLRPWRVPALILGAGLACIAALALATLPAPAGPSTDAVGRRGPASRPGAIMLMSLAPAASASIGAAEHSFWPARHGSSLTTQGGGLHSTFTASGVALRVARGSLSLSLTGLGGARRLEPLAPVAPAGAANEVLYRHSSVTGFYRNGPYGLEQGFTLRHRPQIGAESLVLRLRIGGSLVPEQVGAQVVFRTRSGATVLRYGQLSAADATGRRLPATMQISNGTLQLRVDDSHARYPLRIDPFVQQGGKLTGGGETGPEVMFASNVALSSDGNTALISGLLDNESVGAAWVFTRSGSTWTQQGKKLTAGDETGRGSFGSSLALSADGNTALIGGENDNSLVGAAWVFTRSGATWTQQGSKLTGNGEIGKGRFGSTVALSGDGNTALISGSGDGGGAGAAWVFTRSGSSWTQQGAKLAVSESVQSAFGSGVALSADGNTALIGGNENNGVGAAWVFTRSGATWTQQGSKLTGSGESGRAEFGRGVALSADGNTALIGGGGDDGGVGAAWVFARSNSTWSQQGPKLTAIGGVNKPLFGYSVTLSADGNTALIGGPGDGADGAYGAAWIFTRSGATWTQQGSKVTGSGEIGGGNFGYSVALSSDGTTGVIGGGADNERVGAAWMFVSATLPVTSPVTKVTPAKGAAGGGSSVTITGTNFTGATAVKFGSTSASFKVISPTSIIAVSPAEVAKTVDVTVTTPNGTSAISSLDHFRFGPPTVGGVSPSAGPKAGGVSVTVTGTGFGIGTEATLFKFGTTEATTVNCTSNTTCTVVVPSHGIGLVDLKATVSGQRSPKVTADQYTYN